MKKIIYSIVLLILLAFVFGCGSKQDQTGTKTTEPFIGGVGGLSMEFMDGMPPPYVFDNAGYPFGIGLKIVNDGEADVQDIDGYVEITGINPNDWGIPASQLLQPIPILKGAKKNFDGTVLPGDTDVIEFPDLNYQRDIRGNTQATIRASLCYNYKTYTSTLICVKENLLDAIVSDEAICSVSGPKDPKSSKSPIHITNFRQDPLGQDRLQITFDVVHVGGSDDRVFKITEPDCNDVVTNPERNKVFLKVTSDLNGIKPKCSGLQEASADGSEGFITLFESTGRQLAPRRVTCTLDISGVSGQFEHQLDIELDYKYLTHAETSLEIRDVSTND